MRLKPLLVLILASAILVILNISESLAETMTIKGMHCGSCASAVNKAVCKDKEMSTWFEKCEAKVTDAKKEMGALDLVLKKDVSLDETKKSKISTAIKGAGYEVTK